MSCEIPENDGRISILEKIARLTEVFDPSLMPMDLVQFYASNLGYSVGLNRDDIKLNTGSFVTPEAAQIEQSKFLRFMVSQLPEWYKVKTSRPSIQVMLYSFGLVGDLVYYYTNNYASQIDYTNTEGQVNIDLLSGSVERDAANRLMGMDYTNFEEMYEDLCRLKYNVDIFRKEVISNWKLTNWNSNSIKDDVMNIPDEYYPTPHFKLWFDILESISSLTYSTDLKRQEQIVTAINSVRPINTVFEGMIAAATVTANEYLVPYIRTTSHLSIVSDVNADYWWPLP